MVGKQVELFGKGREQEKKQIRTRPPQQFHNKANMPCFHLPSSDVFFIRFTAAPCTAQSALDISQAVLEFTKKC